MTHAQLTIAAPVADAAARAPHGTHAAEIPTSGITGPMTMPVPDHVIVAGETLHVGQQLIAHIRGDAYTEGRADVTAELQFDHATQMTTLRATFRLDLDAFDGGWVGTSEGEWETNPDAGGTWIITNVGHGYGALDGWQLHSTAQWMPGIGASMAGFVVPPAG